MIFVSQTLHNMMIHDPFQQNILLYIKYYFYLINFVFSTFNKKTSEYSEKASFGLTLSKKIPITKAIRDKGDSLDLHCKLYCIVKANSYSRLNSLISL